MIDAAPRRRGHGENAIYFDATKNRYVGAISVGFAPDGKRIRRKVTGRTKQEVRDKLKAVHAEFDPACIRLPRTRSGSRWTTGSRVACRGGQNARRPS